MEFSFAFTAELKLSSSPTVMDALTRLAVVEVHGVRGNDGVLLPGGCRACRADRDAVDQGGVDAVEREVRAVREGSSLCILSFQLVGRVAGCNVEHTVVMGVSPSSRSLRRNRHLAIEVNDVVVVVGLIPHGVEGSVAVSCDHGVRLEFNGIVRFFAPAEQNLVRTRRLYLAEIVRPVLSAKVGSKAGQQRRLRYWRETLSVTLVI